MSNTSIRDKTIRPGSLRGYSYYHSSRNPRDPVEPSKVDKPEEARSHKKLILLAVLIVAAGFWLGFQGSNKPSKTPAASAATAAQTSSDTAVPVVSKGNQCADNDLDKQIIIGINERRMWACAGKKKVYDSPAITGLRNHPETETPLGTYKIYAKQTDTTLTGADSRGTWSDPVYYWMPFLDNQYGTYGFHDATWRADDAFGKISPDSTDASHGCVELPLAASKWLYNWAEVGTTVTVKS